MSVVSSVLVPAARRRRIIGYWFGLPASSYGAIGMPYAAYQRAPGSKVIACGTLLVPGMLQPAGPGTGRPVSTGGATPKRAGA